MPLAANLSRAAAVLGLIAGLSFGTAGLALAQTPIIVGPGGSVNQGRDCQNIRICNSTRPGATGRCFVTYACRVCETVPSRCTVGTAGPVCHRIRCSWN